MGAFAAGQVVVLSFVFSDPTRNKFPPALLLADVGRGDWIACQITSNAFAEELQPKCFGMSVTRSCDWWREKSYHESRFSHTPAIEQVPRFGFRPQGQPHRGAGVPCVTNTISVAASAVQ